MENKEKLQRFIEKLCNETNSTVNAVDGKPYERGEDYIKRVRTCIREKGLY
jgi:hypothetical protein